METLKKHAALLSEKVHALQWDATLQEKVKDLQRKQGVLDTEREKEDALQDGATQEKAEAPQEKRGILPNLDPVPHSGDLEEMKVVLDVLREKVDVMRNKCNFVRKLIDSMQEDATQEKANNLQGKQGVLDTVKEKEDALQENVDLQGKRGVLANVDPIPHSGEPEGMEAIFDVKQEKADALRKELDAQQGDATGEKVKDLQGKQGVLATPNPPVPLSNDQEDEAADILDALRENVDALLEEIDALRKEYNALRKAFDALEKECDALEKEIYALLGCVIRQKAKDLQRKQGVQATQDPSVPPIDEQEEEEEDTLDVLQENVDSLEKEVDALQGGGDATEEKVKDLQETWEIQKEKLDGFIFENICALEQEAEALWNAWFQNDLRKIFLEDQALSQENVNSLQYYLLRFLQNMSIVKKVDELRVVMQEEESVPCHSLGDAIVWEKVKKLDFALWYINLYTMDEFQDLVDACSDTLKEGPQEKVSALQEKLEAMQDLIRAVPLKELSVLREFTGVLHGAMLDFPRDFPAQEKQDALWAALQNVPLKEICDLWRKVKTKWGIPLKIFAVWEKVYSLRIFLQAEPLNRVWNLQEEVEALKDDLRYALLREEMGAHQNKITALWAVVQDFPLNELGALEDKLNALEERLWNIPQEKLFPTKETVYASQKVLHFLHFVSQGELSEFPEEEMDDLQRTPAEEQITEADKSNVLPAWKTPDTGPGLISVSQQGDLSKIKQIINLNTEQEI